MSKIAKQVETLVRPAVEGLGLSLWDVEYLKEGGRWVLRILIDHPEGVSIDHCEAVSRAVDPILDEADPIESAYVLQVSSAGLERVLKRQSDFDRFIGSMVEVRLYSPLDGKKEIQGILEGYDGNEIRIEGGLRFSKEKTAQVKTIVFPTQ